VQRLLLLPTWSAGQRGISEMPEAWQVSHWERPASLWGMGLGAPELVAPGVAVGVDALAHAASTNSTSATPRSRMSLFMILSGLSPVVYSNIPFCRMWVQSRMDS